MTVAREFARYVLDLVRMCDGRDDVVTTATRYGLDGLGIESQWGRYIPRPSRPSSVAHSDSYSMGTVSFLGVKRPGRGADHPTPSSAEIKVRVQL